MNDNYLLQKSATKAAEIFGITQWNSDLNLIRIYSQLSVMLGGDEKLIRHWVQTSNKHLEDKVPANLLTHREGEMKILSVLESYVH